MSKYMIAATAVLLGGAALAQSAPPAAPAPHADDHVMTRNETVQMVREHFGKLDSNKDGAVSKDEIASIHGKMGDGAPHMVMREGPMGDPNAAFDRLDANKDGMISRDEFAKAREQRIEKRIVMRDKIKEARKDGKLGEMKMHRMGGPGRVRMIVLADTDKDGRITLQEAEAMALKHFDEMDSNHDGQVTPDERGKRHRMMIKEIRKEAPTAG